MSKLILTGLCAAAALGLTACGETAENNMAVENIANNMGRHAIALTDFRDITSIEDCGQIDHEVCANF